MIFLSIFLVIVLIKGINFRDWFLYLKCSFVSAFGFFLGTPYALLDYKTFFKSDSPKGAVWQFQNVGKVDLFTQFKIFFINFYNISDLVAYIPLLLSLIFIVWFLHKRNFKSIENKMILIFIVQFIFVIWSVSGVEVQRAQYFILVFMFIPLFSVLFYENFPKYFIPLYFTFITLAAFGLIKNSVENPVAIFNRSVRFSQPLSNYNFRYNNEDIKMVLNHIGVGSDKFSDENFLVLEKDTHVISDYDLCPDGVACRFTLLSVISSELKKDTIFIYEIKR
jgi:hypothetical protein